MVLRINIMWKVIRKRKNIQSFELLNYFSIGEMRWDEICIILRSHFRGSRLLFGKLILYVRFCRMFHANEGDPWILRYGKLILNEMERKHGKKRCNE